ncbi:MAG: hypothetical protein IJ719_22865 [Clostridia bacterium]|nr:hypothetical protein [Clostridia bacterium]
MEQDRVYMEEYEEEIDIKKLVFFVFSKWRGIIIAGIIGLLLGFAFLTFRQMQPAYDIYDEENAKDLEQYNILVNKYTQYQRTVRDDHKLYQVSLSDSGNYYTAELSFMLDAGDEVETRKLGNKLDLSSDTAFFERIKEILGLGDEIITSSLSGIFGFNFDTSGQGNKVAQVDSSSLIETYQGFGTLYITITSIGEEKIHEVVNYINDELKARVAEYQKENGNCTFDIIAEKNLPMATADALRVKNSRLEQEANMLKNFYNELTTFGNTKSTIYNAEKVAELFRQTYLGEEPKTGRLKILAIAFLVCEVLYCGWILCQFIFGGRIYDGEDFKIHQVPVLAYANNGRLKGMKLDHIFYDALVGTPGSDTGYIGGMLEKITDKNIYLDTMGYDTECQSFVDAIKKVSGRKISCGSLLEDVEAMRRASEETNESILLVPVGKATRKQMDDVLRVLKLNKVKPFGAILLRKE